MSNIDFTQPITDEQILNTGFNYAKASNANKVAEIVYKAKSTGESADLDQAAVDQATKFENITTLPPVVITGQKPPRAMTKDFRVKIASKINPNDIVEFAIMPLIGEQRQVNYSASDLVHHAGQMQIYRTTGARSWDITGLLVSRTADEARFNLGYINLIRSWLMPYYGEGTAKTEQSSGSRGKLGAPPDVLTFSAYGPQMIGPVPVVVTTASWTWPNDVTWIETSVNNFRSSFPVTMSVHMTLTESYSAREYSSFSLADYKNGDITDAFKV